MLRLAVVGTLAVTCSAWAQTPMQVTASATVACKTTDDWNLAAGMIRGDDTQALGQMLVSGRCVMLEQGAQVTMLEQSLWNGLYRVRPKGMTSTYWLPINHAK